MPEVPDSDGRWKAIRPSLAVLLVVVVTTPAVAIPAYLRGVRGENQKKFLKNYRVPGWSESYTNWTMGYVLSSSDSNAVVFLGDSTCVVGVDPRQFTARTGLRAYNLGAPGFVGFEGFLLILRRYLENHPTPRILVLCVCPMVFDSEALESRWPELRERFFWCYGEGAAARRPRHEQPVLDYIKEGIRISCGDMMGGIDHYTNATPGFQSGKSYTDLLREHLEHRGFFENSARLTADEAARAFQMDRVNISEKAARSIRALVRLTRERGMLLIIRPTPVLVSAAPRTMEPLRSWLARLEGEQSNVVVSRPELVTYDFSNFGESAHCNKQGGERFTKLVADEVTRILREREDGSATKPARNP